MTSSVYVNQVNKVRSMYELDSIEFKVKASRLCLVGPTGVLDNAPYTNIVDYITVPSR